MITWHWQTWQGRAYLTCRLLDPFPHGFFTRSFYPATLPELSAVLVPDAAPYRTQQVHGNAIAATEELTPVLVESESDLRPEADGVLSDRPQESLWVCSADCTPVLIADVAGDRAAAVHSGWRGTAAEIVPEAIAQLQRRGSQIEDLRVALGPAISGEVYQVSREVAAAVGATLLADGTAADDPETAIARLWELDPAPVLPDSQPGKIRLDVRRAIAHQLRRLGLTSEQIAVAPHCTYLEGDRFFSYRRTGEKQVQWSGIVTVR